MGTQFNDGTIERRAYLEGPVMEDRAMDARQAREIAAALLAAADEIGSFASNASENLPDDYQPTVTGVEDPDLADDGSVLRYLEVVDVWPLTGEQARDLAAALIEAADSIDNGSLS